MPNQLQQDLYTIRDDLYAYASLVTNADKATIEGRVKALMDDAGWPVLDKNEALLDDTDESITVKISNGKQEAELYLKWERADGSVAVRVDVDNDGQ